ncbi:hypothetical protein LSUE1_G000860, partial [Lachnellula suecica]
VQMAFFQSWQLWEQMTFVLGVAIVAVFCLGYGKVMWRNRLVKRQEIVDEEKRTRIEALRNSGQIIESSKGHDIPFGIKAIQSGIQVDGIWISGNNSPVPSEHQMSTIRGDSNANESAGSSMKGKTSAEQRSPRPTSRQGRPLLRTRTSVIQPLERSPVYDDPASSERADSAGNRTSYKPRKSSHLRYGSYGETRYDEATLGQLEGDHSPKKLYTHRPRGSRQIEPEADSSAADNEHSSGASDSDATLSSNLLLQEERPQSTRQYSAQSIGTPSLTTNLQSSRTPRSSLQATSSKTQYFSLPRDDLEHEDYDPFESPYESPMERSPFMNPTIPATEPFTRVEDHSRLLHQSQNKQPFVPGELHVNKSVRKVNSGFEVLPAGTFGASANPGVNNSDRSERGRILEDSRDRRQSKLQKKRPASTVSGRPSSAYDRP